MLTWVARAALDTLLPASCGACDEPVTTPGQLCADCFGRMDFVAEPLCRSCGLPFESWQIAGPGSLCPGCLAAPPPWGQARAALMYDAASKTLLLPFKHSGREEVADTLALHMHRSGMALLSTADLLVPVPLHRWRLLHRRYNQAALLAWAVSRRTRLPVVPDALDRVRATKPLGQRSARERAALLDGAIVARRTRASRIAGRRIVLIDDVLTSGATARACVHALLDAGAANVDVLVASRVAGPARDRDNGSRGVPYDEDDDADD